MNFIKFRDAIITHFDEMQKKYDNLFVVDLDKDMFYEAYLAAYPDGTNPLYRERTEHDCSTCRHFIKSTGNVVGIKDGKIETIWDVTVPDETYQTVADAMADYVKRKKPFRIFTSQKKVLQVVLKIMNRVKTVQ